jgi:pimeloyl-ACP methyl ester carboxylesterase
MLPDHELIAVDFPGAGSSPPAPRPMRIRALAHLVVHLLDALEIQRSDVLGYSFGGIVAQELAWRAPRRVRRLVLCATSLGWPSLPPRPLPAMLMLTPTRYHSWSAAHRIVPVIAGGRTRRDPVALHRHLVERLVNPPSRVGYFHQLYASTGWTSMPWLWRLPHRTLIVHGDDDPLVPVLNARTMVSLMQHATLRVVCGGGHLFLLDEPESVVGELTRFLEAA